MVTADQGRVFSVRVSGELFEKLEKHALDWSVSRNALVVKLLEDWFAKSPGTDVGNLVPEQKVMKRKIRKDTEALIQAAYERAGIREPLKVPEKAAEGGGVDCHDYKNCRIYRCPSCMAAGKKF